MPQIAHGEDNTDLLESAKFLRNTLNPIPTEGREELNQEKNDMRRSKSVYQNVYVQEIKASGYRISGSLNDEMVCEKLVDGADEM